MAINIYGSCSGSSGSKYDLWLNVKQNSQSIEDNKSNVTVKLLLKRNDGYSSSAYNLNESSNSVYLKVGGKERVNKNLSIDTRNNVSVILATWTGDVTHNDDGTLSLSLSAEFTMGGTSLTGGTVSGSFNCTDIPRASTLTLSKSSINPQSTVTATISSASSKFSHKIKWYIGNSAVTHSLSAGVFQDALTVPLSWSEEITNAKSGKISIALTTYKGTKKIGSRTYSIKLVIPATEEFLPQFTLVTERIDNSVPEGFGEYVKGKSQIKLNIKDLSLKHGASASSYTAMADASSKTSLPATFDLIKSGAIAVSVTVKDSRGFSVKKSATINVRDYSAPTLTIKGLSRCDENGNRTTRGTRLLLDFSSAFSSVNGKNIPEVTYKYKRAEADNFSGEIKLTESPCILPEGEFLNNSSYILAFKITDSITKDTDFFERTVPSSAIPFNIRNGGRGASFGCYAEKDNELTIAWDLDVKGKLLCEDVQVTASDKITTCYSKVRYYGFLDLVVLRMRLEVGQALNADTDYVVATLGTRPTALFTPLNVRINYENGRVATGGVRFGNGEIVIRSDADISPGDYIYISGTYFADYT